MLSPPSLKTFPRYPVTAGIGIMAILVTGMWWMGQPVDWLVMDARVFAKWEIWRAVTATLPHVDVLHLAFNLYWMWTFGTLVEREYGHLKCAAIYLLLALVPLLAEFSLFSGGVGLSGVGYGLWGMLWVLEKRDRRFAGAVDAKTSRLFVIWFFFCVALTVTNVMPVANVAHGVGAIIGILLGLAASGTNDLKWKAGSALVAVVILALLGSTVFWPEVNLSAHAEAEVERAGLDALEHKDKVNAIKWLELSTRMKHAPARASYNLGVAYQEANRYDDAAAAYKHAAGLPDATSDITEAAQSFDSYLGQKKAFLLWRNGIGTNADLPISDSETNAETND